MTMSETFADIYADGKWAEGSGIGSIAETTLHWRKFLTAYLRINSVRTVVDLGCGDWQTARLIDWTGVGYLGIDCVEEVIATDEWCYGQDNIAFACADITTCDIPPADLLIVKDVLQHWPNDAVAAFLERIKGRRAVICNDNAQDPNADCAVGSYRPLDITAPPFSVPAKLLGYWTPGENNDGKVAWCKVVHELG